MSPETLKTPDEAPSILDQVIEGLQARKGEWPAIALRNGVSYSWLEKLARNEIPNPGIRTVERVHRDLFPQQAAA